MARRRRRPRRRTRLSRSPCSRAPGPQARTHSMHSEQMAQLRQRLASATACSSEKPVLTSSQVSLRAAPGRCGMGRRAMTSVCASTSSSGLASSMDSSSMGEEVLAAQEVVDAARARGGRRRRPRWPSRGRVAAASPPANTPFLPVPSVALSVRIWPLLDLEALGALGEVVDHALADGEDDGVAVELARSRSMATGGRQPRASGSPSEQARNSTLLARPSASVTIGDRHAGAVEADATRRGPLSISSAEAGTLWSSSMQLMVTFSAPRRSAVRPASKATSPPPMTTTFLPMSTGFSPRGGLAQRSTASRTPLASAPGIGQRCGRPAGRRPGRRPCSRRRLLQEAVDGEVGAGRLAALQLDAEREDAVDVLLQGGLGQAVLGDAEAQHAAGLGLALEDGRLRSRGAPGRGRR